MKGREGGGEEGKEEREREKNKNTKEERASNEMKYPPTIRKKKH